MSRFVSLRLLLPVFVVKVPSKGLTITEFREPGTWCIRYQMDPEPCSIRWEGTRKNHTSTLNGQHSCHIFTESITNALSSTLSGQVAYHWFWAFAKSRIAAAEER